MNRKPSEPSPGAKEQQLLNEDPLRVIQQQAPDDPAQEASIAERGRDRARQEFQLWWNGLSREEVLELAGRRDELLGLLHQRFGYTTQDAELELEQILAEVHGWRAS